MSVHAPMLNVLPLMTENNMIDKHCLIVRIDIVSLRLTGKTCNVHVSEATCLS